MATLLVDGDERCIDRRPAAASCSLRKWLNGGWGLLFSHPDDFAQHDVEADRWLTLLLQAFSDARVRPIALASDSTDSSHGWLAQVNEGATRPSVADRPPLPRIADLRLYALRESIAHSNSRFVMILDESLRLRRTFAYSAQHSLPSLFDLIATAVKVRTHTAEGVPHDMAPAPGAYAVHTLRGATPRLVRTLRVANLLQRSRETT